MRSVYDKCLMLERDKLLLVYGKDLWRDLVLLLQLRMGRECVFHLKQLGKSPLDIFERNSAVKHLKSY